MRYILSILFLSLSMSAFSQADKYNLVDFSTLYKDKDGGYVHRSEWEVCHNIAVIDVHKLKAIFYNGDQELKFDILTSHEVLDENSDAILMFVCVDDTGVKCGICLITLANTPASERTFIKIVYGNKELIYKVGP